MAVVVVVGGGVSDVGVRGGCATVVVVVVVVAIRLKLRRRF